MGTPASCVSTDGSCVVFARGGDRGATLCVPPDDDLGTPSFSVALVHPSQRRPVTAARFGPRPWLVTASKDAVLLWNVDDARESLADGEPPEPDAILHEESLGASPDAVAVAPDASLVAVSAGDEVRVLDVADCRCAFVLEGHVGRVPALAFDPRDPSRLITVGEDRTFVAWDVVAGATTHRSAILGAAVPTSVSVDPTYPRAAIGAADGTIRFFDLGAPGCPPIRALDLAAASRRAFAVAAVEAAEAGDAAESNRGDRERIGERVSALPEWKRREREVRERRRRADVEWNARARAEWNASTAIDRPGPDPGQPGAAPGPRRRRPDDDSPRSPSSPTSPSSPRRAFDASVVALHHATEGDGWPRLTGTRLSGVAAPLFAGTPSALMVVDSATYELAQVVPLGGGYGGSAAEFRALGGAAARFAFGCAGGGATTCVAASAFGDEAVVVNVRAAAERAGAKAAKAAKAAEAEAAAAAAAAAADGDHLAAALAGAEARAAVDDEYEDDEEDEEEDEIVGGGIVDSADDVDDSAAVSFFPSAPLPEGSPLLATRDVRVVDAEKKSKPGQKQRPGSRCADRPVTFNTRIRSSGYGAEPPRQMLFRPMTNAAKARLDEERRQRQRAGSGGGGASAANGSIRYPSRSAPPASFQAKHAYPDDAPAHDAAILRCEYSPDGSRLITTSADETARVTRLPLSRHRGDGDTYVGHAGSVSDACWSSNGATTLTCSARDRTARMWTAGRPDARLVFDHRERGSPSNRPGVTRTRFREDVTACRFLHMDRFVLLACGAELLLYRYALPDADERDDLRRLAARGDYRLASASRTSARSVLDARCVNDFVSHVAVVAASDRSVAALDLGVGRWVRRWEDAHDRPAHALALAATSKYCAHPRETHELFASSAADADGGCLKLWDVRAKRCARRFAGHVNRQHAVGLAFSPCMRYLATGSEDKSAYLYDVRQGAVVARLREGRPPPLDVVSDVAFHPSRPQLVTTSHDGRARFYSDLGT